MSLEVQVIDNSHLSRSHASNFIALSSWPEGYLPFIISIIIYQSSRKMSAPTRMPLAAGDRQNTAQLPPEPQRPCKYKDILNDISPAYPQHPPQASISLDCAHMA